MNTMRGDLRRTLVIALMWGTLWVALTLVLGTIVQVAFPGQVDPGEEPLTLAPGIGLAGFACGFAFGAFLSLIERLRSGQLPLASVVGWGIVVGAVLPLVMGKDFGNAVVTGPVGAISALASIAMTRWRRRPHSLGPRASHR